MRTIGIDIFQFDELDEKAKSQAYVNWLENAQSWGYCWADEVGKIFDALECCGVKIECYYSCDDYGIKSITCDNSELQGKAAIKRALHLFYCLTDDIRAYCKYKHMGEKWTNTHIRYARNCEIYHAFPFSLFLSKG